MRFALPTASALALLVACSRAPSAPDGVGPPAAAEPEAPASAPALAAAAEDATAPAPAPSGPRTAFVHLFEWKWADVARECEVFLGPNGYAAVQVSPPQEHALLPSHPWWQRYQPVSYALTSRSGDRGGFAAMVDRCKKAGVSIYVDAVLNHMSFVTSGVGSGGTAFTKYGYPGLYGEAHFHGCRRPIRDYGSREEVQSCELATCPDLDTSQEHVRASLAAYLQDLVDLGVAGIRVDAAKHVAVTDLAAILTRVKGPLFVYQEVLDEDGKGPLTALEYVPTGSVTEIRYGLDLSRVLRDGKLAWLTTFGEGWGYLPGASAIAFVDNHDNQRGHGSGHPLTHREWGLYRLANVFMLAHPYGYPQIMSSYLFGDADEGPPSDASGRTRDALDANGACAPGWRCEHRDPAIAGMVKFRNATRGAPLTDPWTDGDQQLTFLRGDRGAFVMNRSGDTLDRVVTTRLPPGTYCDAVTGGKRDADRCWGRAFVVSGGGAVPVALGSGDAMALHVEGRLGE